MSWKSRVIWSEGMFLRPQHFQQFDRYLQRFIDARDCLARPDVWGFDQIKLDEAALKTGKIALEIGGGVFPDGTPFSFPAEDESPPPLDVPENLKNSLVYLGIPLMKSGRVEFDRPDGEQSLARYRSDLFETRDAVAGSNVVADIEIARINARFLLDGDDRSEYACIPMARIQERRADASVVIDPHFIPTMANCQGHPVLVGYAKEILGLLKHRAEALAARVSQSGPGGVAEIADFLLLLLVNSKIPLIHHYSQRNRLHPERLFETLIELAGELASFAGQEKMAATYPEYRHEALQESFHQVMLDLRNALSMVIEQTAVAINLVEKKYGIRVGRIPDRALVDDAVFVLAAKASLSGDQLRSQLPRQIKIGSVEVIRELVNKQVRGIGTSPLPVAPRQIPYHAGFSYFELDRTSQYWKDLKTSGGIALHVSGEYPDLEMELWAIRQ
ncbi:MAG: type VI secretion system baseplate subunit TssK [Wenzhouxiangella sp.]|nr:type VI secretion system baseplate subunit TssK [Wenzhouxiangella sp.]